MHLGAYFTALAALAAAAAPAQPGPAAYEVPDAGGPVDTSDYIFLGCEHKYFSGRCWRWVPPPDEAPGRCINFSAQTDNILTSFRGGADCVSFFDERDCSGPPLFRLDVYQAVFNVDRRHNDRASSIYWHADCW